MRSQIISRTPDESDMMSNRCSYTRIPPSWMSAEKTETKLFRWIVNQNSSGILHTTPLLLTETAIAYRQQHNQGQPITHMITSSLLPQTSKWNLFMFAHIS